MGDPGLVSGSGRSSGEGNGTPLLHSCLENPMDGGALYATVLGVTKSRTCLSDFTFLSPFTFCKILSQLLTLLLRSFPAPLLRCTRLRNSVPLDSRVIESQSWGLFPQHCSREVLNLHIVQNQERARTHKTDGIRRNLLTFKKIPVWLPQQSSGRGLCPEELRQVKNSPAAPPKPCRFSSFAPCPVKSSHVAF